MLPQNIREPADGLNSGSVVVQAEDGFPQIWIFLQHPQHGMFRRTTESHIAVLHAIRGNPSLKMIEDQVQSELAAIQPLELLDSAAPTLHRHVVLPPNGVQVGEVCDDRGLLAAKGQIDEILYI